MRLYRTFHSTDVIGCSNDDLHVNVCGSTHRCGCVVNGSVTMAIEHAIPGFSYTIAFSL